MPKYAFVFKSDDEKAKKYIKGDFTAYKGIADMLAQFVAIGVADGDLWCILVDTDRWCRSYSHDYRWPIPQTWGIWRDLPFANVIDFRQVQSTWFPPYINLHGEVGAYALNGNKPVARKMPAINLHYAEKLGLP